MSTEPLAAKPIINYNLRASQDGQRLWMLTVSKGGVPFRVTNSEGVAAHANQYPFSPQFIREESCALAGALSAAQSIQRILSERCGIIADIYERDSHTLVSKG
jgi:hypothetical protein